MWERALDVGYNNKSLWLQYAEMARRHRPRPPRPAPPPASPRRFSRPAQEMRHKQVNRARNVWDRAVSLLPRIDQFWYKYIHMEEMLGNVAGCRQIFERWMTWEPDHQARARDSRTLSVRFGAALSAPAAWQGWASYIKMELRYNEVERARAIYERYVQCHPTVRRPPSTRLLTARSR